MSKKSSIYIASDHAGFPAKTQLKLFLEKKGYEVLDLGPKTLNKSDDYPDFAFNLGKKIKNSGKNTRGIIICGSGVGVCIAANRINGVRAVYGADSYVVKMSRADENSNVLCFGARNQTVDTMKKLISLWLKTKFTNLERHKRRLKKLDNYEN